jgi:hypothetical protein
MGMLISPQRCRRDRERERGREERKAEEGEESRTLEMKDVDLQNESLSRSCTLLAVLAVSVEKVKRGRRHSFIHYQAVVAVSASATVRQTGRNTPSHDLHSAFV